MNERKRIDMTKFKLGFIGVGNMAGSILEGVVSHKAIPSDRVFAYDIRPDASARAAAAGVHVLNSVVAVAEAADVVLLGVKPEDSLAVIRQISSALEGKALLSIVAGLRYEDIGGALGGVEARVLTVLPNTPIRVGAGATGFTTETTFSEEEKEFARELFEAVGIVEWVPTELLPAVSALSGGGPAYAALFVEALADGGVLEGLPRDVAYRLAAKTIEGTGRLILETDEHPGVVKDNVCSPGGTTIEAVKELERNQFRYAVSNAVHKSYEKFAALI